MTLVRPGDAVYLAAPLLVAAIVMRSWPRAVAVVGGLVAGGAEWVVEAYARFGGIASRLHAAGAEQGGFGLHFALPDEFRALNGRRCAARAPSASIPNWTVVVPAAGAGGAGRAGRASGGGPDLRTVMLPVACGLCVAAQYLFMIDYAAPRFLLPAYALLAVQAADGLAFLITGLGKDLRPAMTAAVTCFLVVQLLAQHLVLDHEVGGTVTFHDDYTRIAAALAAHGVRPPCLIQGVQYIPIAFYAGCASAGSAAPGDHVALLVRAGHRPPDYARNWRVYRITGTTVLKVNAYIR